jgi:hypothetical protein
MSIIEDRLVFYINSAFRISGTDSDFTYFLKIPLGEIESYDNVCVVQAQIPKSYWIVNEPYNTFQLKEDAVTVTITIPPGNYNRKSFATTISSLLSASSPNTLTYTITYPNSQSAVDKGYYTITVINSGLLPISIIFPSVTYAYQFLGFNAGTTNSFTRVGVTSTYTLTSKNVIQLIAEDALYIRSDICDNRGTSDVLQDIYSGDNPNFSAVVFQTPSVEACSKKLSSNNKNVYRFTITDEYGVPINLNGVNCLITLMIYKQQDVYKSIKGAINYYLMQEAIRKKILTNDTNETNI